MAELAVGLLGPAIELVKLVAKPIKRQFNYLCCFTSNINSLKNEAIRLDDALGGVEMEVDRARDNVQVIVPEVTTWLTNSNNIKDEINGILSEATNVESGCLKLGARFRLSKRAKKATDRTKELRGQKNFKAIFQPGPPAARQAIQLRKTYEFESRNKIEEDIMATLRGGDVNMLGIYGMGGLGKTTMAEKIMNRALKEHVFEEAVMAVLTQNVDKSKVQADIGGSLGLMLGEENSERARVQKLHERLSDKKRILLVLDDVWEGLALEDFGIPRDSKMCTILITSRNSNVLRDMEVEHVCEMEVLSEEEAWFFFRERAGKCVDDRKLNPIAKDVAKECRGLPIALTSVSAVLKDEDDVSIWEDALRQLSLSDPDIPELITEVYNPLKLSYDFLRSEQAKSMLLLFCLFREDADIPLEYLTYFCMGLDIYKGIRNLKDANNKTRALTKTLKSLSLLLDSDRRNHVRMHDVVRDVCIFIAKQEGRIGSDDCTWISSNVLDAETFDLFPNLRLLFLNRSSEEVFKLDVERTTELKVLCIQNYSLTTLPHTTQSLAKLNTLILDSCEELKTISVVGELVNLKILICYNCGSIEKLPSEMKALTRLKLLELTRCKKLQSISRGIISSLVALEELKMLESFNQWEAQDSEVKTNAALREVEALTNLTCLQIQIDDPALAAENMHLPSKLEKFIILIPPYADLPFKFNKEMSLCLESETRLGEWIKKQLLQDSECLNLSGNGVNDIELVEIQNIRWLHLSKCESMKNVVRTSMVDDATVFPLMEFLDLQSLPELEEIWDGPISSNSFHNLKELRLRNLVALEQLGKKSSGSLYYYDLPLFTNLSSIDIINCHRLRNLGRLSFAGKEILPQLQKLRIEDCEMMEQVFLWNDDHKKSIGNSYVITKVFPKLEEVKLDNLPNLTTFYQGAEGIEFPLLTTVKIQNCPQMTMSSFYQGAQVSLGNLKELEVDWNPLCDKKIHSSLFKELEVLHISQCEDGLSLFSSSTARNLVNLRELCIYQCDEMISVIEYEEMPTDGERILLFPKLEKLELVHSPKLVTFSAWQCEVEFPSLREVVIVGCRCMKNLSLGLVVAPNVEYFSTDLNDCLDVSFDGLKELSINENENPLHHHKLCVSLFNGLEVLSISRYEGCMSLFTCSMAANLVNLRKLSILMCFEMERVIEEEDECTTSLVFPKLEELHLSYVHELMSFCECKCDVKLPRLRNVVVTRCPYMKEFTLGRLSTPNLGRIIIDSEDFSTLKDLNGALQQHYFARVT